MTPTRRERKGRSAGVAVAETTVAWLEPSEFSEALAFYRSVGYSGGVLPEDSVVGARLGGSLIGLVRLSREHGGLTLRGMQVAQAFQRRGIGSRLLETLAVRIADEECFCLPHEWLAGFYGQIGFERIEELRAPAFLQGRLRTGRKKHASMIVMRRQYATVGGGLNRS